MLQTTITLGYDVSWRKVHDTLIQAAIATDHILSDPSPFVLQTSLDDYYVSYQLNAYTYHPQLMMLIYSQLHENIQDKCNEGGIEILSPHYRALRDGNMITIPENYLPSDYSANGFKIES
jgi:small-conductance mechanosensitive channel